MTEFVHSWVVCRCGKEHQVRVDAENFDVHRQLLEKSLCRTCEMEVDRNLDKCPETIVRDHGVSRCSLTWHHEGRCIPIVIPPETIELLRREMDHERS